MTIGDIPATNVGNGMGVVAREGGGVAAINGGDVGRVGGVDGERIEYGVGDYSIVVGEIQEVLDNEVVRVIVFAGVQGELWENGGRVG